MILGCCLLDRSPSLAAQPTVVGEDLGRQAVEAERRGDFAAAVSAFKELLAGGGDSPELRSNLGIAYFQLRQFDSAVREFRAALAKTPDSVPANLFCGLSLLELGRPKHALPLLEEANRVQPRDPVLMLALARAEIASNEVVQARVLYQTITGLDAKNAEAWYGLGIASRALAEQETKHLQRPARALMTESEAAIAKAMELDPHSVHAHMIMGESFRIAERYDLAVREYKAATEEQPDSAAAWAGLAVAYSASGNDDSALQAAERALTLDSNDADTNALIAGTYIRKGDYAKAEPYALRALRIEPGLSSAQIVLAKVYLNRKQPEQALPELESAVKDDSDGSTYYLLATTLKELGRPADAANAMQRFRQLHSAHVREAVISR